MFCCCKYHILQISDHVLIASKDVKVAIIPPLQQTDKILIAKNSSSCKDTDKSHAQKSSSWSWKDKLKLSRRVWSASNLESFIDISSSSQTQVSVRYV